MIYTIDRTEDEILIKLPLNATAKTIQNALNFIRYVELGQGSNITQGDVDELVKDTNSRWREKNKERFRDVEGFEEFFK